MNKSQSKRVSRLVKLWRARLGLQNWEILIEKEELPEDGAKADCNASPEYLQAKLRFDLANIPAADLESYVVHELFHLPVWPLAHVASTMAGENRRTREWVRLAEEGLVTHLERFALSVFPPSK